MRACQKSPARDQIACIKNYGTQIYLTAGALFLRAERKVLKVHKQQCASALRLNIEEFNHHNERAFYWKIFSQSSWS